MRCLWTKTLFTTSNNIQESSQASVGVEDLAWKWFICNSYPFIPISCLIITKIWWLVFILAWSVLVLPKVQEWGRWICRWTLPLVNYVYFYCPIYLFVEKTNSWRHLLSRIIMTALVMRTYKQEAGILHATTKLWSLLMAANTTRGCKDNTRLGMARILRCRCGIVQEDDCVWLIFLLVLLVYYPLYSYLCFRRKKMKHCQRHNGPEGWVHLTKVT